MIKKNCFVLFGVILLISCQSKKATNVVEPVGVKVIKITASSIGGEQCYSGTVEESSGTSLSFSVGGTVKRVLTNEGQRVSHGQLLAIMDDQTVRNSYTAALSMRQQAEDAYKRMKQLHDNGSLPEIQWVETTTKLQQAVSAEQIAKKSLNDTKLYAPFAGVISEKNIETGQNAIPGIQAFKLVKINQVKVKISVPESEVSKFKVGQTALIRVSALDERTYRGHIIEKGVTADAMSRSYNVKILLDNKSGELMPGMICDALFNPSGNATAFVLPASVIQLDDNNRHFVWVDMEGKAKKRLVNIGTQTNGGIIISNGLSENDEVLVEGQQKVSENTSLKIEK